MVHKNQGRGGFIQPAPHGLRDPLEGRAQLSGPIRSARGTGNGSMGPEDDWFDLGECDQGVGRPRFGEGAVGGETHGEATRDEFRRRWARSDESIVTALKRGAPRWVRAATVCFKLEAPCLSPPELLSGRRALARCPAWNRPALRCQACLVRGILRIPNGSRALVRRAPLGKRESLPV